MRQVFLCAFEMMPLMLEDRNANVCDGSTQLSDNESTSSNGW